jgi:transposase
MRPPDDSLPCLALTTGIHAAVDAPGLPVRPIPTAGRRGARPQAAPIEGRDGVGHITADATRDAGRPRTLTARARHGAPVEADPSRAIRPPRDPARHAERHEVAHFFRRIRRLRRIALRCGKALTGITRRASLVPARDGRR